MLALGVAIADTQGRSIGLITVLRIIVVAPQSARDGDLFDLVVVAHGRCSGIVYVVSAS